MIKCEGIQNIRDYYPVHDEYRARGILHRMFYISTFPTKSSTGIGYQIFLLGDTHECLKMQNFIDSFVTNTRTIYTRLILGQKLHSRVNAVIKMVRHEGPCSIFNAFPYVISFKKATLHA